MNNIKSLKRIVLVLITLNIVTLSYFGYQEYAKRKRPMPPVSPLKIAKELGLDERETQEFIKLAQSHHKQIMAYDEKINKLMSIYFSTLINEYSEVNKEKVLDEIGKLEQQKIHITYSHFRDVKKLLNNQQQKEFKHFVEVFLHNISGQRPKNIPPPPKGF
jgi:hypothetical protein